MFSSNKELVKYLGQAFSEKDFEFIKAHVADDVNWKIVGMPLIQGKEDFIMVMEMMELECFPDISVKNIIAEGDFVVVESEGAVNSETGKIRNPSFCEVYLIKNGKLQELTTYVVDTSE